MNVHILGAAGSIQDEKQCSDAPRKAGRRILGVARDSKWTSRLKLFRTFVSDVPVASKAHPHDIGTILDQEGIAIRTGTLAFYNTREEIDALVAALDKLWKVFA